LHRDYDHKVKKKDEEINELKRKIEEMSAEFAKMLRDTLDKMQDRIENVQWDNDSNPQMMKKKLKNIDINWIISIVFIYNIMYNKLC